MMEETSHFHIRLLMKWLFTARSFGILLIVLALGVLGWATVKDTRSYQQVAKFKQSLDNWFSLRPTTYLQSIKGNLQLLFCEDGSRLFVRSGKGHIAVYETGSWKKLRQWKTDNGRIFASADGKRLFIGGSAPDASGYRFSYWDVDSGKRLFVWSMPVSRDLPSFQTFNTISPDLSQVVLNHHQRNPKGKGRLTHRTTALWIADARTGKVLHRVPLSLSKAMPSTTRWEEQTLFITSVEGVPQRFRISDWKPVSSLPAIANSRFSADGNLLAGARNFEGTIFPREVTDSPRSPSELVLYNRQTKATQRFGTDFYYIRGVFPAADALIVSGFQKDKFAKKNISKSVVQIRTPDGQAIKTEIISGRTYIDAQWKLLAIDRFEGYFDIYRAADGKRLYRLDKIADPLNGNWEAMNVDSWTTAEFSPDGKWCVVGEENGLIRIWALPYG